MNDEHLLFLVPFVICLHHGLPEIPKLQISSQFARSPVHALGMLTGASICDLHKPVHFTVAHGWSTLCVFCKP